MGCFDHRCANGQIVKPAVTVLTTQSATEGGGMDGNLGFQE